LKSLTAILAPPLLCAGVLAGIAVEKSTHVKPHDAAAYHAHVKRAIDRIPSTIGGGDGEGIWVGEDVEPTKAAVQLLRPNIILSRRYIDTSTPGPGARPEERRCDVLIVKCWDSRDMVGHYPENCYVNAGDTLIDKRERDWQLGVWKITGTEYTFERFSQGKPTRRCIYNFLVVPGTAHPDDGIAGMDIVRDIKQLNKAAEDYQRRYFGAAQFQFVMSADVSREKRDQIFRTLMGNNLEVLDALNDVAVR
jgi:hypothetical protein